MSEKKKLSEMTPEEKVKYYQHMAAEAKKQMVKKANERYMLIGKIVSETFVDIPAAENELQAYFTNLAEAYHVEDATDYQTGESSYHKQ